MKRAAISKLETFLTELSRLYCLSSGHHSRSYKEWSIFIGNISKGLRFLFEFVFKMLKPLCGAINYHGKPTKITTRFR